MIVKGKVIGYQVFGSGACQIFVSSPATVSDKVKEYGDVIRCMWQSRGTYDFNNPPNLLGAEVIAYVGRSESGIIDINMKGGVK